MKRIRVIVSGEVQGVSFRNFIKRNALLLNLKGYAKNLSDGRVEAVFEGDGESIKKIITLCCAGPEKARVKDIKTNEEEFSAEFNNFSVL